LIERFYDRVSEGIPIDETWKRCMIDAATPKLPDNPTPAELDAWIELAEIVSDPKFIENLRENANEVWGKFDMEALRRAGDEVAAAARDALARSIHQSQRRPNKSSRGTGRDGGGKRRPSVCATECASGLRDTILAPRDAGSWSAF
jgi:hypothetical protein